MQDVASHAVDEDGGLAQPRIQVCLRLGAVSLIYWATDARSVYNGCLVVSVYNGCPVECLPHSDSDVFCIR